MTIGSITPTNAALAALGSTGSAATSAVLAAATGTATGADTGLFTSLLRAELQAVAAQLDTDGVTRAAASAGAGAPVSAAAGSTTTPAAGTSTAAGTSGTATPVREFVVTYVHGEPPASTGKTPAPLVKGTTGGLVITAKTTGLTQLTRRFTGTVGDPTAAAKATPTTMATIARLQAAGQA